jgi:hypothetical protein
MPDERLFHLTLGHSEKVNRLTDFERSVWWMYKLAADDFGVMRFSAAPLQDAARWLERKSSRAVLKALETVYSVGLVSRFEHQGQTYVYQADWQTWQKITYPRPTKQPAPPLEALDLNTAWLFSHHPNGGRIGSWQHPSLREQSRKDPPLVQELSRNLPAPSRVTDTTTNTNTSTEGGSGETDAQRAGAFGQWYEDAHQRIFGVGYMGTNGDYTKTLELVARFTDQELRDAALVWFGMDDDFASRGTRSIPKFASRVTGCLQEAKKRGIA